MNEPLQESGSDANASIMLALHESREALELVLENSPDAVFVEDLEGNVVYVNSAACRLHEMTQEELLGANVLDLVPPDQRESVREKFGGWRTGELRDYTGYSYTKSGKSVPVEIRANSVIFQGQPALVLIVRNISDRLHAQAERDALHDQLQNAQKLESLGAMAGGIAHDFNNLLMGILGNTELAIEDLDDDSTLAESLRGIEVSAGRAAELCRQMLAYAGQGKSHIEPIVLTHVIRDLSHLLSPPAFKNAELVFELDEDLPAVEGDLGQIQQVILNLVTNACEALESNVGTVSVRTGVMDCDQEYLANTWLADALPSGEYVFLEISDYGIGMDDDMLKKIVDPFFTTKVTGRGMGLAAVLGIIRGHSGAIQIVSSPGEGSTFTVLLPVAGSEVPSEFAPVCSTAPEGAVTILVVDDEDTIRSVARRMLTRMDVTVVESCNGEEAVSIIAERGDEIACVLLDLSMPRMGGMEAVKKMRQLRQDLPVVLMSGYDKSEAIGRFSDVELQGFLQKPFHGDSLRDVLRSMMHLP